MLDVGERKLVSCLAFIENGIEAAATLTPILPRKLLLDVIVGRLIGDFGILMRSKFRNKVRVFRGRNYYLYILNLYENRPVETLFLPLAQNTT